MIRICKENREGITFSGGGGVGDDIFPVEISVGKIFEWLQTSIIGNIRSFNPILNWGWVGAVPPAVVFALFPKSLKARLKYPT